MNENDNIKQFNTDPSKGLKQTEVDSNRKEYGYNEVLENKSNVLFTFLLRF